MAVRTQGINSNMASKDKKLTLDDKTLLELEPLLKEDCESLSALTRRLLKAYLKRRKKK